MVARTRILQRGRASALPAICGLALGLPFFLTLEPEHFPSGGGHGDARLAVFADGDLLIEAVVDDLQLAAADGTVGTCRREVFAWRARGEHLAWILETLHAD